MKIIVNNFKPSEFLKLVDKYDLFYGEDNKYISSLSPNAIILSQEDQQEFNEDINELTILFDIASKLYLNSFTNPDDSWIQMHVEHPLEQNKIAATKLTIENNIKPNMMRIDYISFDSNDHKIAEVQWRFGGPGLYIGHDLLYQELYQNSHDTIPFGDLANSYLDTLGNLAKQIGNDGLVLNENRITFLKSEMFLVPLAQKKGFEYIPIVSDENSMKELKTNNNGNYVFGYDKKPVAVIRGIFDTIPLEDILNLTKQSIEGKINIETTFNYILRQKWPMALPFIDKYKSLFSDRLRKILAPTIVVNKNESIDFSPIIEYFPTNHREKLLEVKKLSDLAMLSESIRRSLIIKNSSGTGEFQNRGKGVFRLTGSKKNVVDMISKIIETIYNTKDTWIIQLYISKEYSADFINKNNIETVKCHSRFCLFGGRQGNEWLTQGAIANFAKHWKVSGGDQTSIVPVRICK